MATSTLKTRILLRNDTTARWEAENPTLSLGEVGIELADESCKIKIGDGVTDWLSLGYTVDPAAIDAAVKAASKAENVYFEEDLVFTKAFGKYVPGASGNVEIPTATDGMSVADLLINAFAEPTNPKVSKPAVTLTLGSNISTVTKEVGETWNNPTATASVTTGSFEFGSVDSAGTKYTKDQGTGITFTSIKVTDNYGKSATGTNSNNSVTLTSDIAEASRVFTDGSTTVTYTVEASYPAAARYPLNNLGQKVDESNYLTAGTCTSTKAFTATGYRCWFTYIGEDATAAVDSAFIREGTNLGNAKNATTTTVTIPAGTKRVVIALPNNTTYTKKLTSVVDVDGMGLDVMSNFAEKAINVQGANGASSIPYRVYVAENAEGLAATRYTLTIK